MAQSLLELLTGRVPFGTGGGQQKVFAIGQGGSRNPFTPGKWMGTPTALEELGLASRTGVFQGPRYRVAPENRPAPDYTPTPYTPRTYFGNDWSGMRATLGAQRMGGLGGMMGGQYGGPGQYGSPQTITSLLQLLGGGR